MDLDEFQKMMYVAGLCALIGIFLLISVRVLDGSNHQLGVVTLVAQSNV